MDLFFLGLVLWVVSFLMGFVPVIGPILLGFCVESINWNLLHWSLPWNLHKKGFSDESPAKVVSFFFVFVALLGLAVSSLIFYEPAPGLARYEPVPGMTLTQVIAFVIAYASARSNRM